MDYVLFETRHGVVAAWEREVSSAISAATKQQLKKIEKKIEKKSKIWEIKKNILKTIASILTMCC